MQLAKNHYKNACMVIVEIIKSLSLTKTQIKQRVEFKNADLLEKYLAKDQSVIIVTAHYCNLEWALLACSQHVNYPIDIIYRAQRVAWIESLLYELRTRFSITPLPMETCIAESVKRSKITRIVAMAPDQSPKIIDTPHWQTFLNRDTAFHNGAEKIAKAFKYPLIFMSMKRTRKGYYEATLKLLAEPPYPAQSNEIMHRYVNELETLIIKNPQDWLWAYRRWKINKRLYN